MIKLLVCDYVGQSGPWIKQFINLDKVEIARIIVSSDKNQDKLISSTEWDYVLVFEQNMRNIFLPLANAMNIPPHKIFYALELSSWSLNLQAAYSILKPREEGYNLFHRYLDLNIEQQFNNFITCTTVDGLSYIATSKDRAVMPQMYVFGHNHAADEMEAFHQLSQKYYYNGDSTISKGGGYFLDLGANIGTTCVYFKWKFDKSLKILAFEPDPTNYMLLKMNVELNNMTADAILENYGLGAEESYQIMHINPENPGNNSIYPGIEGLETEKIHIVKLDEYLSKNNIPAEEIKYIWIDVEGFEAQVILGAENLLTNHQIPIFMEFNPMDWNKSGYFDKMVDFLEKYYSHFIIIPEYMRNNGSATIYSIRDLLNFRNSNMATGSMGDIFLIKQ